MTDLSETPFRLYTLTADRPARGEYVCVCSTDDVSLGEALLDQFKKGVDIVGIMYRPVDGEPGEWLLNPWAKSA